MARTKVRKQSEEHKRKRRESWLKTIAKKPFGSGEKAANWKGGRSSWLKNKVLKDNDYTCKICGLKDQEIVVVDHIKPRCLYPELVNIETNLQVLCPNCHARKSNNEKVDIMRARKIKKFI